MSDHEKPKPIPLVPGQFPTGRASHAMVFHAGGTFVISFLDERMVVNEGKIGSANFEAGRFALSPVAALWLGHNLKNALKHYIETFGPLPKNVLSADAPQLGDVIASLEEMLKESRQPPDAPQGETS